MVISKLNTISRIYLLGDCNKYKHVQLFILNKEPNLLLTIQNIYTMVWLIPANRFAGPNGSGTVSFSNLQDIFSSASQAIAAS